MKVTDLKPIGRIVRGNAGFRFFRSTDGKPVVPLSANADISTTGPTLGPVEAILDADRPAWLVGGDYVVYGCMLDKGVGEPVLDHVVVSWSQCTPNAWLVQDGGCFQGEGARSLLPDDFDWERSVTWIGHFQAARMELKRHMLTLFPDVRWCIVYEDDRDKLIFDGQHEMVPVVKRAMDAVSAAEKTN